MSSARETWRPVVGHPTYEVSDRGRVRNARTGRVLRPQLSGAGYRKVHLGRGVQRLVHRLVAEAFHGPPALPTDHADHLDFDRTNNHAGNLRWLPAAVNIGRQVRWGSAGWEVPGDQDVPEGHVPLSPDERARIDAQLSAPGW